MKLKIMLINICKFIMRFIYSFMKLHKTEKQITFVSRQTDDRNLDFEMLSSEIRKAFPDYKVVVICKTIGEGIGGKVSFVFSVLSQMNNIAKSKLLILDSYCLPASMLHHKSDLKIMQLWHALGALKKFGYSILDQNEGRNSEISKAMCMHANYDYIVSSSEYCKNLTRGGFAAEEKQMVVLGLPRIDFLKSTVKKEEIINKFFRIYPEIDNGKKNILYVPTFRMNDSYNFEDTITYFDTSKYNLIIKDHEGKETVIVDNEVYRDRSDFLGIEMLHVGDYIITDYSAIAFEAAITQKPLYFYIPDYDIYTKDRGFYIDFKEEMPGVMSKDINTIINAIENEEWYPEKIKAFLEKYVSYYNKDATGSIIEFIKTIL